MTWAPVIASAALLATLAFLVDVADLAKAMAAAEPPLLAVAAAAYLGAIALRGARLAVLLSAEPRGGRYPLASAIQISCIGTFANHVLPAKGGDLATAVLPRFAGSVPMAVGAAALVAARLHDIVAIILLTLLALMAALPQAPWSYILPAALLPVAAAGFALGAALDLVHRALLLVLPARLPGGGRVLEFVDRMRGAAMLRDRRTAAVSLLLSLASWTLVTVFLHLLLAGIGIGLPPHLVFLGNLGTTAAQFLPISAVGNLGVYEAGWVFGFVGAGLSLDEAAATALLSHLLAIVISGVAAALSIAVLGRRLGEAWRELRR